MEETLASPKMEEIDLNKKIMKFDYILTKFRLYKSPSPVKKKTL